MRIRLARFRGCSRLQIGRHTVARRAADRALLGLEGDFCSTASTERSHIQLLR